MDKDILYHKKSGILFKWSDTVKSYEPIMRNVRTDPITGELVGDEIVPNTIYHDFILYIRYSSMVTDKRTGKKTYGVFEIYQWAIAFSLINDAMSLNSGKSMTSISRQAGKSYSAHKIVSFILIFVPHYVNIPEDRYYCVFCSPKNALTADHMSKMRPDIDKAVELYNLIHKDRQIISDNNNKQQLLDREYDIIINGERIHYSQIVGLSLQESVINAG